MVGRYAAALGLILATAAASAEAPPSHAAWTRAAIGRLPVYFEDRQPENAQAEARQLDGVAAVIADVSRSAPRPPREWAALLLTVGYHESTFSLRIHRGDCKPRECDAGRARSAWQLHRNAFTAPVWDELFGLENTETQVRAADGALRRAYWTCARSGQPWLVGTLNAFAGRRCSADWPGLQLRAATFTMLVGRHSP